MSNSSWPECAGAFVSALGDFSLPPEIQREELICSDLELWGIACSGGSDSVALLLWLWHAFPAKRRSMRVLHFDHQTRSAAEHAVELKLLQEITGGLGLKLQTAKRPVSPAGNTSEAALREARLEVFNASKCPLIWQGHHADDVIETLLMRITRGSGLRGLAAPAAVSRFGSSVCILRPFLEISKRRLVDALRAAGCRWCEDPSNAAGDYLRNRIRASVVPALEAACERDLASAAARTRRLLAEAEGVLDWALTGLEAGWLDCLHWPPTLYREWPPGLLREALWKWWSAQPVEASLEASTLDEWLRRIGSGERFCEAINPQWRLRFEPETGLFLESTEAVEVSPWSEIPLILGKRLSLPGGFDAHAEHVTLLAEQRRKILEGRVDVNHEAWLAISESERNLQLSVRPWKYGDRYQPLGAAGSRKLSDVFVDKKWDATRRRMAPVFCLAGAIVWVPGLPPLDARRINASSRHALKLTCGVG